MSETGAGKAGQWIHARTGWHFLPPDWFPAGLFSYMIAGILPAVFRVNNTQNFRPDCIKLMTAVIAVGYFLQIYAEQAWKTGLIW